MKKATVLYGDACEGGFKRACTSLGLLALKYNPTNDLRVTKMGMEILTKSCRLGEQDACKIKRVFEAQMAK